tara:strand:+ start:57789 stop:58415 length:627 start_codon:yes stop_codon:yes gene_type:complete
MQSVFSIHYLVKFNFLLALSFLFLLCFSNHTFAKNQHIYDHAKIYSSEEIAQYDKLLQDIEDKSALRVEAVIVKQFSPYQPKEIIDHLWAEMAKREPPIENSILLVVSIQDNFAVVVPTNSIAAYYPEDIKKEIVKRVSQNIQSGSYNTILQSGVGGIVYYYDLATKDKKKEDSSSMDFIKTNAILLGVGLLVFAFFKYGRRKPRIIR